jgi:protein TonB
MYVQQAVPAAHMFPGTRAQAISPDPIVPLGRGIPPPEPPDPEVPDPPDPEVVDPPDEPPPGPPAAPAPLPPAPPAPFGSSLLPHAVTTRDKISQNAPAEIHWRVLECSSFVVVVMAAIS